MPLVFTREEIRELLALNGYADVPEEALDRFMSDLKKLIKHEDMKRRRKRLGHDSTPTTYSDSTGHPSTIKTTTNTSTNNGESVHYNYASDDEEDGPRFLNEIIAAGSIKQPDFDMIGEDESDGDEYDDDENVENLKDTQQMQYNYNNNGDMLDSKKVHSTTKSTRSSRSQPQHQQVFNDPPTRDSSFSSDSEEPGTSREILNERTNNQNARPGQNEIKWNRVEAPGSVSGQSVRSVQSARSLCSSSVVGGKPPFYLTTNGSTSSDDPQGDFRRYKPNPKLDIPMYIRRDPVLLYQYYKVYWDQTKIPGEEKHLQLRWNARQVIYNKPCIDGKIVDYLGSKANVLPKRCSSAKH